MGKVRHAGDKPSRLAKPDVSILTVMTLTGYLDYAAAIGGDNCRAVHYLRREIIRLGVGYVPPCTHQQMLAVLARMMSGKAMVEDDQQPRIRRTA